MPEDRFRKLLDGRNLNTGGHSKMASIERDAPDRMGPRLSVGRNSAVGAGHSPSSCYADMVWIPESIFCMGSDRHYPEEAPVHRVTVDAFWIDRALP